jgi:hypothetical protein
MGYNYLKYFVDLCMLLQLENTNAENINKLLAFANQHHLQLSIVDEEATDYTLPGKPLAPHQLTQLIEKSRKSGMISMEDSHKIIRKNYNGDQLHD